MTTLSQMDVTSMVNPVHLLLVGPSKVGKTDWIADAAIDGFTVFYVDNDNGLNTLHNRLKNHPEALARVHYVKTANIWTFLTTFFARTFFQWNETRDEVFSSPSAGDDDDVLELRPKQVPFGVLFVFDSWTSTVLQLLQDAAKKNGVSFENFNDGGQAAFGDASRRANVLCSNIQAFPGHVIVQAHPDFFERQEKPKGSQKDVKQKDMVIKENIMIPMSVSRPHGYSMAKFFNEVGWMKIGPMGNFLLDFKQLADRVGGGTLMNEGDPKKESRLSKIIPVKTIEGEWIRTVKAASLKEEARIAREEKEAGKAVLQALAAKAPSGATTPAVKPAAAASPFMKR